MAKQGMRRERFGDIHGTRKTEDRMPKNEMEPVSEIQGKAKKTKQKANKKWCCIATPFLLYSSAPRTAISLI